ncbi:MAG TPA: hypothetical protein VMS17_19060 [Gemmataceae bacterium]|nr:hypothetical protein [Gemmataceae bacterium]
MSHRGFFALLSFAIAASAAYADNFLVTLKVVDADQKPVAKAEAALFWNAADGVMTPSADKPAVADADGKIVLRVDVWSGKRPALVLSADRALGGVVGVGKEDDGKELTVALGPTVRIIGKLECKELNSKPEWANTIIIADGFQLGNITQNVSKSAAFDFTPPAGKYTVWNYGSDVEGFKQTIELTADHRERDLGVIDLKASPIAKMKGKTPPDWIIADARGAKKDVRLADYKGKWVYIEFWGFW